MERDHSYPENGHVYHGATLGISIDLLFCQRDIPCGPSALLLIMLQAFWLRRLLGMRDEVYELNHVHHT